MLKKVITIISEYQDIPETSIRPDSHLINDLGLSSYDVVGLISRFEDEFDIEISDRKIRYIKTVEDIVQYIYTVNNI